ncbi:MAG: right-handed parallel beta-helix repeat-containing protein [Candidatus Eisenbacteria bacterium]|nr:right-handed parallel beta-helix repeat-containing protein [Candidatus Eisenbacteria bacterium]
MRFRTEMSVWGVLFLLLPATAALAVTHQVPTTFNTIQAAVNAASSGDVVVVASGTYAENLSIKSGVEVIGAGPDFTILDGGAQASTVFFPYGVNQNTRIEGFTIRNGKNQKGGGIMISAGASPTITNCFIRDNVADFRGGGIYMDGGGEPTIEFCTLQDNWAVEGAAVYVAGSNAELRWSVICSNSAEVKGGGVHIQNSMNAVVEHNTIAMNHLEEDHDFGCGLSIYSSIATVSHNIIAWNTGGGGFWVNGSLINGVCNLGWANDETEGECCFGDPGPIEFEVDPLFCDAENCDLRLSGSSPALNPEGCGLIGALTIGCEFTPTENTSWGDIKKMYR